MNRGVVKRSKGHERESRVMEGRGMWEERSKRWCIYLLM